MLRVLDPEGMISTLILLHRFMMHGFFICHFQSLGIVHLGKSPHLTNSVFETEQLGGAFWAPHEDARNDVHAAEDLGRLRRQ